MVSETMPKKVYDVSASTTPLSTGYALDFLVAALEELKLYTTDSEGDHLVDSANYAVTSDVESVVATLVTFSTTYTFPEGTKKLTLTREVAVVQEINLVEGMKISAETLEAGLDNNCRISLMLAEQLKRAPKMSISSDEDAPVFPDSSDRAGKMLAFDEDGQLAPVLTTDIEQKLAEALAAEEKTIQYTSYAEQYSQAAISAANHAAESAFTCTAKAESAEASATSAMEYASNAMELAQSAQLLAGQAKESATNAATSEANAKTAETAASTSATNAKASETNAKTSENNAKSSETTAKTSETKAAASATQTSSDKASVSSMKSDVSSMKDDVSSMKSDISAMKTSVEATAGQVATDKSDVSSMKTEVETMKTDVATMKSDVTALVDNVAAITVVDGMVNITYTTD